MPHVGSKAGLLQSVPSRSRWQMHVLYAMTSSSVVYVSSWLGDPPKNMQAQHDSVTSKMMARLTISSRDLLVIAEMRGVPHVLYPFKWPRCLVAYSCLHIYSSQPLAIPTILQIVFSACISPLVLMTCASPPSSAA